MQGVQGMVPVQTKGALSFGATAINSNMGLLLFFYKDNCSRFENGSFIYLATDYITTVLILIYFAIRKTCCFATIKSVLTIAKTNVFVIFPLQYWIQYHELQASQPRKKEDSGVWIGLRY